MDLKIEPIEIPKDSDASRLVEMFHRTDNSYTVNGYYSTFREALAANKMTHEDTSFWMDVENDNHTPQFGYRGFVSSWLFDKDGRLLRMGHYE